MADQILVPFSGEGSGIHELSWGQRDMWAAIRRQRSSLPIGGTATLRDGTTVDDMADLLRFIVSRHQPLRTRVRFDADGRPLLELAGSGEVPLEVVDAGDADPAQVAAELEAGYRDVEFDYENEWPVRMGVVCRDGFATHVVAIYCHLALDRHGLDVLIADLATKGTGQPPPAGMQPMEQAAWQRSPAGQRQNRAAMRYWNELLGSVPPRRFRDSQDKRSPRHWELVYDSPAAHLAVTALAARNRVESSHVLLAAFAVALGRITGQSPAVTQLVVSNRFRPGFADTVSTVNHSCPVAIDVSGGTFDEVVGRVWRSSIRMYKYAYYDPDQRDALIDLVASERGEPVDLSCFFNDRRVVADEAPGEPQAPPDISAAELTAALSRSTLIWEPPFDVPIERLFFSVNDAPDSINLSISGDSHFVPPADLEACARIFEETLVRAVLDPTAPIGVDAPATGQPVLSTAD